MLRLHDTIKYYNKQIALFVSIPSPSEISTMEESTQQDVPLEIPKIIYRIFNWINKNFHHALIARNEYWKIDNQWRVIEAAGQRTVNGIKRSEYILHCSIQVPSFMSNEGTISAIDSFLHLHFTDQQPHHIELIPESLNNGRFSTTSITEQVTLSQLTTDSINLW